MTFSITVPPDAYDILGRVRAFQRLLEELRAVQGVRMATAMTELESRPSSYETEIHDTTMNPDAPIPTVNRYQRVMSGYFETMGIPILKGRGFQPTDAVAEGRVAVVNETLARTYWRGRDPIGQRLRPCCGGSEKRFTVPLATLAPTIARVVRRVDPAVPVARLREMGDVFNGSIRRPRILAQLLTLFSVLALLLAAIGTYGVLDSMVAGRRREMAIRLALGAQPAELRRQVMTQGMVLAATGVAAGLAGILGLDRLLTSLLFGVHPVDVMTLAIVIPSIAGTAALACWLPAWRASRLDPNVVLRVD